ncbi:hypothetical protein HYH02_015423 [Chlamydomonas schloesseri]|uniref:Uncharacterized protein n=1 Tax=Chlamydomonas schloesseri TaxID=2026947 RepID=A0A835SBI3_9CHLO|nr:hypothetical protein HYH02_015423 [Chlamydomonas schloesseri]|eukprot:KAG2422536.1 hypothetical protein HYH02_015423 [Chlamydomonas schloesseri]
MSLLRTGRCPTATRHAVEWPLLAPLAPLAARPVVAAPTRTVVAHGERRSANRTKWATADPPSGAAGPAVAEPVQEQTVAEQIWDCAQDLAPVFTEVDRLVAANVRKVQKAFRDHRIGPHHFQGSTGYGHGDLGREALDSVMAQIMGAEAALMRVQFVSGTHAIASALYAVLRPGDEMLAVAGHPYDTMEEVIGTRGTPGHGSLMEWGVSYRELALTGEGRIDWEALKTAIVPGKTKVAHIQRSCGYALRPTLSIDEIGKAVQIIKAQDPNVVITVDNCYGEFTDTREPCDGGTIAPGGGYVAGRADLIGRVAARLYAPGVGIDAGGVPGSTLRIFFRLELVGCAAATELLDCLDEALPSPPPSPATPRPFQPADPHNKTQRFLAVLQHPDAFMTPKLRGQLRQCVFVIVRGYLSGLYRACWGAYLDCQAAAARALGMRVLVGNVCCCSTSARNAASLFAQIASHTAQHDRVIILAHSHGTLAALELLRNPLYASVSERIESFIPMNGVFGGTPMADLCTNSGLVSSVLEATWGQLLAVLGGGEAGVLRDMTAAARRAYHAAHGDRIAGVLRRVAVVALVSHYRWPQSAAEAMGLAMLPQRMVMDALGWEPNDGCVPLACQILPGADYVVCEGLHHVHTVDQRLGGGLDLGRLTHALLVLASEARTALEAAEAGEAVEAAGAQGKGQE